MRRWSAGLTSPDGTAWGPWLARLPFVLLLVGGTIGLLSTPLFDHRTTRLVWLLVLLPVTAAWLWWCTVRRPALRSSPTYYVVRTALAFALTWANPFLAVFAFVGYLDAFEVFRGRRAMVAMTATAVTMAGSQSGGLPPRGLLGWAAFGALLVLNSGLSIGFAVSEAQAASTSERRADTIVELERVNAELEAALAENAALHEQVVAQAREAGMQDERRRLAREIHDTLAQSLAGIVAQLQAVREEQDPASASRRVEVAVRLARDSLVEARRSVRDLSPAHLDGATLPEALTALVETWRADRSTRADLVVTGEPGTLHPEIEATVLRIAQEALTNTALHARASRVGVTLSYLDDDVILDVRDDGVGFDRDRQTSGYGLRGMSERARRVAGALDVESGPGRGTAVSARLPAVRVAA